MITQVPHSGPGWITIVGSVWLYPAAAAVVIVLLGTIIFLFARSKSKSPKKEKKQASRKPAPQQKSNPDAELDGMLKRISKLKASSKCILLAAERISDLPVTVPVKLAAALSENGPCLLIDLDSKRNALAKVFDVDSSHIDINLKVSPLPTPLPDVQLWPAEYFDLLKQMNLRSLIESAQKKYNSIILYAPYLSTLADRKQIACCAGNAILFEAAQEKQSNLELLLKTCKCSLLLKLQPCE